MKSAEEGAAVAAARLLGHEDDLQLVERDLVGVLHQPDGVGHQRLGANTQVTERAFRRCQPRAPLCPGTT